MDPVTSGKTLCCLEEEEKKYVSRQNTAGPKGLDFIKLEC